MWIIGYGADGTSVCVNQFAINGEILVFGVTEMAAFADRIAKHARINWKNLSIPESAKPAISDPFY